MELKTFQKIALFSFQFVLCASQCNSMLLFLFQPQAPTYDTSKTYYTPTVAAAPAAPATVYTVADTAYQPGDILVKFSVGSCKLQHFKYFL